MKRKREGEKKKCDICGKPATIGYWGRYGFIRMCTQCYNSFDLLVEKVMNTDQHWEAIKRKVG